MIFKQQTLVCLSDIVTKPQMLMTFRDNTDVVHCSQPSRQRIMTSPVFFLVLFILCSSCTAQVSTDPPDPLSVEENQADILLFTGKYLGQDVGCTVKEVDGSSNIRDLQIDVTYLAVQGSCDFNVTLVTPVDYEKYQSFKVDVYLRQNCAGIEIVQKITKFVAVINVMDTAPAFPNSVYSASIPENREVNTPVLVNIRADDADGTDSITYTVNFVDQQNQLFEDRRQANPEILDIYLISSLDFEQQHTYRFTITAVDSVGMNSTCDVIIKVINIQDTPPYFSALQYNGRVSEDTALGTLVLIVNAVDGDSVLLQGEWDGTSANEIYYSIINGGEGMFAINSSTGEITTITPLDIDNNTNVRNGLVVLNIRAEELNTSMEPQYGDSSSTVLVRIQIEDANDNRPQFNGQSFTGSIAANAVVGEFITLENGGYISVQDIDQAPSNNRFCLHIEQGGQLWDIFKPNIEAQYAYASVMIQLNKNNSLTDLAETHVIFQIVAQECGGHLFQSYPPTKSDITVWVKPHTAPADTTDPIINLPLSTSDIIVFIVGLLLLLNIGFTIFICYALRGGRSYPMTLLNRDSKYRVTNWELSPRPANKTAKDEEVGNVGTSRCTLHEDHRDKTNIEASSMPEQAAPRNTVNGVNKIGNVYNSDLTMVKENTNTISADVNEGVCNKNAQSKVNVSSKPLTKDSFASRMKPDETLVLSDINQLNFGINKRDETRDLHHADSFQTELSETAHNGSSSSSFSENKPSDKLPLIKFSHVKTDNNYKHAQNTASSLSDKNGKLKQPTKKNTNVSLLTDQSQSDNSIQKSENENKLAAANSKHTNNDQKLLPIDKDNDHLKTGLINFPPPATQLTQTGVPPIALALPYSTGTFNVNKEAPTGVVNPVFETLDIGDNKQTGSMATTEDRTLKLAPSDKNSYNMPPLSTPAPADNYISQDREMTDVKMNEYSTWAGILDMKHESPLSDKTPLNANGSSNHQSVEHQGDSINSSTEQLQNIHRPSAQAAESPPSHVNIQNSQDYMAAAKELLSTKIKNSTNPGVIHDVSQLKNQTSVGGNYTSF